MFSSNFSRRHFLTGMAIAGMGAMLTPTFTLAADAGKPNAEAAKKPLIVYFSHSGNTKKIAENIQKIVGGDIVQIEAANAYPEKYNDLTAYAKKELESNARPPVKTRIDNPDQYGVIFLGYPNWWSSMPMPVYTFIEQNKLDGKTIAPFVTHGGGGLGHSIEDLKKIAPHAKVLTPLAVNGNRVGKAEADVKKWLEGLGSALIMTTTGNPAIYPNGGY